MMRLGCFLAVSLLAAAPARASGLPEFEGALAGLRAAVLAQPLSLGMVMTAKSKGPRKTAKRVTDPDTWARMTARALQHPTLKQGLRVGDTDYEVFAVVSEVLVPGQLCAADARPRNALYVAQAVGGPGGAVYPVRLTSVCVGPARTEQYFALDADADGLIQDAVLSDPGQGRSWRPLEQQLTPAQLARFDAFMAALVGLFAGSGADR